MLSALLLLVTVMATQAPCQEAQSASEPAQDAQQPEAPKYFFSDLPPRTLIYDGTHVWIKPIFAVVGDYTAFSQDAASLTQVGEQKSTQDLRAGRIGITIRSKGALGLELFSTVDYQEPRTRESQVFELYDLQLRLKLGPVKVAIGKQKETISYELTGLSALLPQQERILLPFFATRNIGVSFSGVLDAGRVTWAAGAFNDWLIEGRTYARNASDYDGRVTYLAWSSPDKANYVHMGVGVRSQGADDGTLRFAGRPESNVADKFVDSGDFPAKRAEELSLEGLWSHGRFSMMGEHFGAWVDSPETGNPHFSGSYLTGSWFVTGESRRYIRELGYAGGISPKHGYGAVELVLKYSQLDITDGAIDGGVLHKWHYGINWWASNQWKLGFSYGDADLTRDGLIGNTEMLLTRLQWLY